MIGPDYGAWRLSPNPKTGFLCFENEGLMVNRLRKKKTNKITMCRKIEMEVPFTWNTEKHFTTRSQIVCSVPNKWHFPILDFLLCKLFTIKTSYQNHKKPVLGFGGKRYVPYSPRMTVKTIFVKQEICPLELCLQRIVILSHFIIKQLLIVCFKKSLNYRASG